MTHLNKVTGLVFLAAGLLTVALAAVVSTDAFTTGARTDASSYEMLTSLISTNDHGTADSTTQDR
jgi:hypothetical protein